MSSIGLGAKITSRSFMNAHSKQIEQDRLKPPMVRTLPFSPVTLPDLPACPLLRALDAHSSCPFAQIQMTGGLPADSFMGEHLRRVSEQSRTDQAVRGEKTQPVDTFMTNFHKKTKETMVRLPLPFSYQSHSYCIILLTSHFLIFISCNQNKKPDTSGVHAKPMVGTDDFTMTVQRKAQKDVMSY